MYRKQQTVWVIYFFAYALQHVRIYKTNNSHAALSSRWSITILVWPVPYGTATIITLCYNTKGNNSTMLHGRTASTRVGSQYLSRLLTFRFQTSQLKTSADVEKNACRPTKIGLNAPYQWMNEFRIQRLPRNHNCVMKSISTECGATSRGSSPQFTTSTKTQYDTLRIMITFTKRYKTI